MAKRWTFYGFDWRLFDALEEPLREAAAAGDFGAIDVPGAADTLAETASDAEPHEVAGELVSDLCCLGEPIVFDRGLPEFVLRLRRHPGGEDAAEMLGRLLSTAPNVKEWFAGPAAPAGILGVGDTAELAAHMEKLREHWRPPQPRGLARWTSRFSATDPPEARLVDLMRLVDEARAGAHGLAVLADE